MIDLHTAPTQTHGRLRFEATRDHAKVLEAGRELIEREPEVLYEEWSGRRELAAQESESEQTRRFRYGLIRLGGP
ncbi:MAG: hypothetical protein ACRBK7_33250 [Acidimicrobiales bacterium]